MKAQKIALGVMGVIALVLLTVVLSTVGSLSSIADQRASNAEKIVEIEQKKVACESAWNALNEQLKKKLDESLSYAAMERADRRTVGSGCSRGGDPGVSAAAGCGVIHFPGRDGNSASGSV